jgi:hypothetical protein
MAINKPEQALLYARIVARTWADEGFKNRLLADPADVLSKDYGLVIPQGMLIIARENTHDTVHVAIDAIPVSSVARDEVERLSAASTFGSAGTLGTAGTFCGCFGTAASLGTAGSWDL